MPAISNGPFGFRPIRHYSGGEVRARQYPITSAVTNYNTAIFYGDLVTLNAGYINVIATNTSIKPLGVFVGCFFTDLPNGNFAQPRFSQYWPGYASGVTDAVAYVVDDPDVVFQISANATALASTALGRNANMTFGTSGSTRTGLSGVQLDGSTVAVTNTLNLRIHNRVLLPGNDWSDTGGTGQNLLLEVSINPTIHYFQQSTAL